MLCFVLHLSSARSPRPFAHRRIRLRYRHRGGVGEVAFLLDAVPQRVCKPLSSIVLSWLRGVGAHGKSAPFPPTHPDPVGPCRIPSDCRPTTRVSPHEASSVPEQRDPLHHDRSYSGSHARRARDPGVSVPLIGVVHRHPAHPSESCSLPGTESARYCVGGPSYPDPRERRSLV